jgi:syntaxin-binding protein 1
MEQGEKTVFCFSFVFLFSFFFFNDPLGVTLVEPVYLRREPQSHMEAVYYLEPSEASIGALIKDFDENFDQYAAVHLLFTRRVSEEQMAQLKEAKVRRKVRSLKELYLDYLASEQRVFHLDMQQALWNLFSPAAAAEKDVQLRRVADKLVLYFFFFLFFFLIAAAR